MFGPRRRRSYARQCPNRPGTFTRKFTSSGADLPVRMFEARNVRTVRTQNTSVSVLLLDDSMCRRYLGQPHILDTILLSELA